MPACTDLIQAIDAGIGRSIRIYVGHALDKWLSVDDNMDAWEERLNASQRRVLMTNFCAEAMSKILEILNTLVMTDGDDDDDDISRDTPLIPEGIDVEDDDLIDM